VHSLYINKQNSKVTECYLLKSTKLSNSLGSQRIWPPLIKTRILVVVRCHAYLNCWEQTPCDLPVSLILLARCIKPSDNTSSPMEWTWHSFSPKHYTVHRLALSFTILMRPSANVVVNGAVGYHSSIYLFSCSHQTITYLAQQPSDLVEMPPLPLFWCHRYSRRSGRDPAPVSGKLSFFYRITPDVGPTYLRLSVCL